MSIIIGFIAGIIDVIPMLIMQLEWNACLSAFVQWIILGIFINYISWDIRSWLKGIIVAELAALPIMIMVYPEGWGTIGTIALMSAILGSLVGYYGEKYR